MLKFDWQLSVSSAGCWWLWPLGPAMIDKRDIFLVNYSIAELRFSVEFVSRSILLVVWLLFTKMADGENHVMCY